MSTPIDTFPAPGRPGWRAPLLDSLNWLKSRIDTVQTKLSGQLATVSVSVKDNGALGNGTANDQPAFQAAINGLSTFGGGEITVPNGLYVINGGIGLKSNIRIRGTGEGSVLTKTQASPYVFFYAVGGPGATGYGASVRNVYVSDLTFRGHFGGDAPITCGAFALNHAQGVIVERCHFIESQGGGHTFDLGGCKGITIRDSTFQGMLNRAGTDDGWRAECIQIDLCQTGSVSYPDDPTAYDALPTCDVLVENCQFLPLTVDGVTYPAPNPIGSHALRDGVRYRNIRFLNNYVLDPPESLGTAISGSVHFHAVDGLYVRGNTFEQTTGRAIFAIYVEALAYGSIGEPGGVAGSGTIPAQNCANIFITDNTFKGFKPGGATGRQTVFINGLAAAKIINVVISNNDFSDGYNVDTAKGEHAINVEGCDQVTIHGNNINSYRVGIYPQASTHVSVVGNTVTDTYSYPIYWSSDYVTVADNVIDKFRAACACGANVGMTVTGNVWSNPLYAGGVLTVVSGTSGFAITGNMAVWIGTDRPYAYNIAATATKGVVTGNGAVGYTHALNGSTVLDPSVIAANNTPV